MFGAGFAAPGRGVKHDHDRQDNLVGRAYRWLARRERSRAEMKAYLQRHCEDETVIASLLDTLEQRGELSETRLAEQVVRARRTRASATRIRQELARRGLGADTIAVSTEALEAGDYPAALALWRNRFRTLPEDRPTRERQIRFLLGRGFSYAIALKVLREAGSGVDPAFEE